MKKYNYNNKGVAIFITIALLFLLSVAAIGVLLTAYNYNNICEGQIRRMKAITSAEAGVNYAYYQLRNNATTNFYPNHKDIFVEMLINDTSLLHQPLTDIQLTEDKGNFSLELYSSDHLILKLHSDADLLRFIYFVLGFGKQSSIFSILQNLRVPSLEEFKPIIKNFSTIENMLREVLLKTQDLMSNIISTQISISG